MLRHFLRSFQRGLSIKPAISTNSGVSSKTTAAANRNITTVPRTLFHVKKNDQKTSTNYLNEDELPKSTDIRSDGSTFSETDADYIVPYRIEREKPMLASAIVEALRQRFRLSSNEVNSVLNNETIQRNYRKRSFENTIDQLALAGVSRQSLLDFPWLLILDKAQTETKIKLIKEIKFFDINHFVVFLRLTVPRLKKLIAFMKSEEGHIPYGNRLYYISNRLKTDPYEISKFLSKRLFILEMPYDMFEQNLQHMLNYNVSPQSILKDLWAFRYAPKSVKLRLERAKSANKDKIMPWMVRCTEPILQKSLKLSLDELAVLGDKNSTIEYLAERLQFSTTEAKAIMAKHPQVFRVRVTKIKEVLDYLESETDFTRFEIAQVPRILCHKLETTKQRMAELKSLGCRPSSLTIVCRSKREYQKFVNSWLAQKQELQQQNKSCQT